MDPCTSLGLTEEIQAYPAQTWLSHVRTYRTFGCPWNGSHSKEAVIKEYTQHSKIYAKIHPILRSLSDSATFRNRCNNDTSPTRQFQFHKCADGSHGFRFTSRQTNLPGTYTNSVQGAIQIILLPPVARYNILGSYLSCSLRNIRSGEEDHSQHNCVSSPRLTMRPTGYGPKHMSRST